MEKLLLNGRVAIVDDKIEEARPLMDVFSKKRIPFTYYSGDTEKLPDADSDNDIRVLFLDLYLGSDSANDSQVKGTQDGVLRKLIHDSNYPYLIILWTKHPEKESIIQELFDQGSPSLTEPIKIIALNKGDFFNFDSHGFLDGGETALFQAIIEKLKESPTFHNILQWENVVHKSADEVLQDTFRLSTNNEEWETNAVGIMDKLGQAYLGKTYRDSHLTANDKLRASLNTLNLILMDEIEVSGLKVNAVIPVHKAAELDRSVILELNYRLLVSKDCHVDPNLPGSVIPYNKEICNFKAGRYRNSIFNRSKIREAAIDHLIYEEGTYNLKTGRVEQAIKDFETQLENGMELFFLTITPLCDYAQKKDTFVKTVVCTLVNAKNLSFIEQRTEAIFVSPVFKHDGRDVCLCINFNFLITLKCYPSGTMARFRLRQQLVAEIQSKMSRFLSRQGILFLDNLNK